MQQMDERLKEHLCTFRADPGEKCEDCKGGIIEGGPVFFFPDGGMSPDGTYRCERCATGCVDGSRWQDEWKS